MRQATPGRHCATTAVRGQDVFCAHQSTAAHLARMPGHVHGSDIVGQELHGGHEASALWSEAQTHSPVLRQQHNASNCTHVMAMGSDIFRGSLGTSWAGHEPGRR